MKKSELNFANGGYTKFTFGLHDEEGKFIEFKPVRQEDGTYLLTGKESTDIKENTGAQE